MNLFTPNTSNFSNYYDKGKYLMAWRMTLFFLLVFIILTSLFGFSNPKVLITFSSTLCVGIVGFIYLTITKNFKLLFWFYTVSGTIIVHLAMNYVLETNHFVDFVWIIVCILFAFIGLGKTEGFVFITIHLIGIAYFLFFSLNSHIEALKPQSNIQITGILLEMIFAFTLIAYMIYQYMLFHNYSQNQIEITNKKLEEQNQIIRTRDNEKTTLVKEVHHRVKNNLQIIISLLRLQKSELKSEEAKKHFSEAINRIMVMSLIHKKLYQEKELAHIDIESYLTDLANDINTISNLGFPVNVNVSSEIDQIGLKTIVPLGLLANELISNSVKHAFFKKKSGEINIQIKNNNNNLNSFKLFYNDDGSWVEPDKNNPSFGLELIEILTSQLEGECSRVNSEFIFTLKNLDT